MKNPAIIRSMLFVPGNRPDRINKALDTKADVVIIDLEDAVPPSEKADSRQTVRKKLNELPDRPVFVRINGMETEFFSKDLEAVVTHALSGLMLPKVESGYQVEQIHSQLLKLEKTTGIEPGKIPIVPLIETALGVRNVYLIASDQNKHGCLLTLSFGAADFTMDMGINMTDSGKELDYPRARIAIACRAAGLRPPIDTPYMINIKDTASITTDAERARRLGFQGKLCVHPVQVDICNKVFSPTEEEVIFAKKVIEAFQSAESEGIGVIQINGKLIDLPILERARQIVSMDNQTD